MRGSRGSCSPPPSLQARGRMGGMDTRAQAAGRRGGEPVLLLKPPFSLLFTIELWLGYG